MANLLIESQIDWVADLELDQWTDKLSLDRMIVRLTCWQTKLTIFESKACTDLHTNSLKVDTIGMATFHWASLINQWLDFIQGLHLSDARHVKLIIKVSVLRELTTCFAFMFLIVDYF